MTPAAGSDASSQLSAGERWDTRYEWRVVVLLSLSFGLVGLDR